MTLGISPAISRSEHQKTYRLPIDMLDLLLCLGFQHTALQTFFSRAADAVIFFGPDLVDRQAFTRAIEDDKPIGMLTGMGETFEETNHLALNLQKHKKQRLLMHADPVQLIRMIASELKSPK